MPAAVAVSSSMVPEGGGGGVGQAPYLWTVADLHRGNYDPQALPTPSSMVPPVAGQPREVVRAPRQSLAADF